MIRALLLAVKDIKVILADRGNIFWVFGFPVIFALFFGAIYSGMGEGPSGMKIAIVDEDGSEFSNAYVSELEANDSLTVFRLERAEAIDRVRRGKVTAAVMIKSGFGDGFGALFDSSDPKLEIAADPAQKMASGYLQGLLAKAQFEALSSRFADRSWMRGQIDGWREDVSGAPGLEKKEADLFLSFFDSLDTLLEDVNDEDLQMPMEGGILNISTLDVEEQREGPATAFQIIFPQAMIWAILGCTATFAVSIVKERTEGTFDRLRIGPLGRSHILAGKGLACFATCCCVMCIQWLGARLIFKTPIDNPLLLIFAATCAILCFAGLLMFVSTLGRTEQSVGGAAWAMLMIMAMIGGGMMPLFFMPEWLRSVSNISPVKWGIYAIEGAIWRHFTLAEMLGPCLILLAIGLTFFALGVLTLRRQEG
ncbi:MAG: ABC transporter permease [Phycisphaerales bacterium]|nr:MAG: ABC transporter permease [Phycisphaerales bacterium]